MRRQVVLRGFDIAAFRPAASTTASSVGSFENPLKIGLLRCLDIRITSVFTVD
jgi:hypothetical protein